MTAERAFQVDLRGVVDLLSRNLYSSPRVYLRELLQNAVDAVTARGGPGRIDVRTGGGEVRVSDDGIGLSEDEVHQLLATIGRSSKRDELGFARHDFLGHFGIGLLSAFLVADEIDVVTRSVSAGEGPGPAVRWTGRSDGRYTVTEAERGGPGTTVTLRARPGAAELLAPTTVAELARTYAGLLPVELTVDGVAVTAGTPPPWQADFPDPARRRRALEAYCHAVFGFEPLAVIDLEVPEAGLTGAAFVLPHPVGSGSRRSHRVYLKRMLLAESVDTLLPEWAFFVRCVVDAGELRPTANREALYEDDLLESVRVSLGERLRGWLTELAETDPAGLRGFLRLHHLGVKAMAVADDAMLGIVDEWLEFETSAGSMTLAEFRRRHRQTRYAATVEEFRRLSAVSGAQGIGLVNAGYVHDVEIVERLAERDPATAVRPVDAAELTTHLGVLDSGSELALRPFLEAAGRAVERLDCEVVVREFDPASLPALYMTSRAAQHRAEMLQAREEVDELWAEVLGALSGAVPADSPQLVLNHRNPLTRRVTSLDDPELVELAVQGLYAQALLLGQHPLKPGDTALLNRSFRGLLERAVQTPEDGR